MPKDMDAIVRRLRRVRLKFGPAATRVLDILADDPNWILDRTSLDIAYRARTSDATVIRTIQALGYAGLQDLRRQVEHASRADISIAGKLRQTLRDMRPGFDGAVDQAAEVQRHGLAALRADVASGAFRAAIDLLYDARRIVVLGSPPWSGLRAYLRCSFDRLGIDAVERDLGAAGEDGPGASCEPGDLLVVLALPPLAPSDPGMLASSWRRHHPLLVISDVPVATAATDLVGLRVTCGAPGHLGLASPVATLVDALLLGLLTCCPEGMLRRATQRSQCGVGRREADGRSSPAGEP